MEPEILQKITDLRHALHMHPELSLKETWTKRTLMEFIETNTNLTVEDRGRWFFARYDCGDPAAETLGFRADFDALPMEEKAGLPYGSRVPGVCHKCGHDGHSAALAGLAMEIDRHGAGKNIYFIFQHGEEIGAGGEECAALIRERSIDRVFAFHNMSGFPEGSVIVRDGVAHCTSKGMTVRMEGVPAHASQPEDGRNPAAALARLVLAVEEMNGSSVPGVRGGSAPSEEEMPYPGIPGSIASPEEGSRAISEYSGFILATVVGVRIGSRNFGISASSGEVSMTLRADYEADLRLLERKIRIRAEALGRGYGLAVSFEEQDFFPETVNDPAAVQTVREAARRCGLMVMELPHTFRASEDFGYYLKQCPGAIFYIGNGEDYPPIHTHEFDFNDRILETAVAVFREICGPGVDKSWEIL